MELCKGYMVNRYEDAEGREAVGTMAASLTDRALERLFAVMPDGAVYATYWIDVTNHPNNHFDVPGRLWSRHFDGLPAGAEFIGNYEPPKLREPNPRDPRTLIDN